MKVIVYHGWYGCETGCCGHVVEVDGEDRHRFHFDHPYAGDDPIEFAKNLVTTELGEEHVKDLDWEHCIVENGDDH